MMSYQVMKKMDNLAVESNLFVGEQDSVTVEMDDDEMVFKVPGKGMGTFTEDSDDRSMRLIWEGLAGSWFDSHTHSFSEEHLELVSGELHLWWDIGNGMLEKVVLNEPGQTCVVPAGAGHFAHYPVDTQVLITWTPPLELVLEGRGVGDG